MRIAGWENHQSSVSHPKFLCSFITLHSWANSFIAFCFERRSNFFRLLLSVTALPRQEKFLTKHFHMGLVSTRSTSHASSLSVLLIPLYSWKQTFKSSHSTQMVHLMNVQRMPQSTAIYRKTNTRSKNDQGERWEVTTTYFLLQRVCVTKAPWFIELERRGEFSGSSQGLVITKPVPWSAKCFV